MNKWNLSILFVTLIVTKAGAQDFLSDSLRVAYSNAKSDSGKVTALIELAKHNWNDLFKDDTAIVIVNSALLLAKESRLTAQEVETMMWLGKFYSTTRSGHRDPAKALQLTRKALALSRQYHLKQLEADLLLSLGNQLPGKADSAKLLIEQALQLALQYKLVEKQTDALKKKADFYAASHPDSAKIYLLEAISLARNAHLPVPEITLLRSLAETYSLNHWGDSSNYLMQEAVKVARQNGLIDQEIRLLRYMSATEAGFFLKDSLIPYYDRMRLLSRQFKRDSLRFMENFAQSATDIGNFPEALKTYLTLLHAYEERKDSASIENVLYGIALSYEATNDYKKTIEYLYKAEKYGQHYPFIYIFIHVDFAKAYLALKQNDSAQHYAAKAYKIATDFYGTPANIYGGVLNDLGSVYNELGEDSLAIDYLRRSYVFFTSSSIQYLNYCSSTLGLAKYFNRKHMADSSFFYAKLCLATARDKGFLPVISESSALLVDYFQKKHNADSALHYQQIGFEAYKTLYNDESSRQFQNMSFSEQQREQDITLAKKIAADQYSSNLRLYALITVVTVAILIGLIVFRNSRQRQKSYDLLKKQKLEIDLQKSKLQNSFNELQATQSQLIQSEKMASLGELTAGIAHEIQNPLNFVNNFSEVNTELIEELEAERNKVEDKRNVKLEDDLITDIKQNLEKIAHHGKRADAIVKGMLQHSRSSSNVKEPTDINALADEFLRLAYHGLRVKDKSFNASIKTDYDETIGKINIIPQDIGRVLLNLYNNAFYAVSPLLPKGGVLITNKVNDPTIWVSTKRDGNNVLITVRDNGKGIPGNIVDKIFQPFFTTKPTGQGTGLGLSLSYDIIKAHGGDIKVESEEEQGTQFIIQLPIV